MSSKSFAERVYGDCSKAVAYCFMDKNIKKRVKNDMVEFGIDEANFTPFKTPYFDYRLTPVEYIGSFYELNGYELVDTPDGEAYEWCGIAGEHDGYCGYGFPLYVTESGIGRLKDIALSLNNKTVISLELYDYLIERNPELHCFPVFVGEIYDDEEYIRLHDTSDGDPDTMVSYSLLEHCSIDGDVKILGAYKTENIPDVVQGYAKSDDYARRGGAFFADKSFLIDDNKDHKAFSLWIWYEGHLPNCDELGAYDERYADYHNVYRNKSIALQSLDSYLANKGLRRDDVIFDIVEIQLIIDYHFGNK